MRAWPSQAVQASFATARPGSQLVSLVAWQGGEFMSNLPPYFQTGLEGRMDPIRIHLQSGLRYIEAHNIDMGSYEQIQFAKSFSGSFLLSFFADNKCCCKWTRLLRVPCFLTRVHS